MYGIRCIIHDFINGLYSGIPLCCVINFCRCKSNHKALDLAIQYGLKSHYDFDREVNYVPCKKCHETKTYNELKHNGSICEFLIRRKVRKCTIN